MLVKERMTLHPLTMDPTVSITEAHRYMKENNIRHLPIVGKNDKLVGLVTRETLMQAMPSSVTTLSVWEMNYALSKVKTRDVMVRDVITVEEDVSIEKAARIMAENKIGCLPVMRNGSLVGIITDTDMLSTLMELMGARQAGVRLTLQAPDAPGALAKITTTIAGQGGDIASCGTYPAEEPLKFNIVLKVRHVPQDNLVTSLRELEDIKVLDVRAS
ncbi:MAG: CBS and ACT domain-containing protein [Chloroflexi bacterium]|nr:CBS and ACT domain-containing protein [Chloroflexota bacterium]